MSPQIAIVGATGLQGGSVVETLLSSGSYQIRALTRNPASEPSKALASKGVEVVRADLWDLDSVKSAFRGCRYVFGVTNYWDPSNLGSGDHLGEVKQGRNIAEACKAEGVQLLVWSSLIDASKVSGGKYKDLRDFDNKVEIEGIIREVGVPHVFLRTCWFAEDLWKFFACVKKEDGTLEINVPRSKSTSKQPILWVARTLGPAVQIALNNVDKVKGQTYGVSTGYASYDELAQILSRGTGKEVTFASPDDSTPTFGAVLGPKLNELYEFLSGYGDQFGFQGPDPRLIEMGLDPGSLEEFASGPFKKWASE